VTATRRRLRRFRLALLRLFSTAVILLAAVFALTHLALPWLARHPERIGEFLSARLERAVTIDHADGIWERNGPLLVLSNVRVAGAKAGQPPLVIPQAELKINFFSWLSRSQTWNEFRVTGLNLTLARDVAGAWQLRGLDTSGAPDGGDNGNALFDLGSLVLRNLTLTIDDAMASRELAFRTDEVRLIMNIQMIKQA